MARKKIDKQNDDSVMTQADEKFEKLMAEYENAEFELVSRQQAAEHGRKSIRYLQGISGNFNNTVCRDFKKLLMKYAEPEQLVAKVMLAKHISDTVRRIDETLVDLNKEIEKADEYKKQIEEKIAHYGE